MARLFPLIVALLLAFTACKGCKDPCKNVECAVGEICMEGNCGVDRTPCDPACEDDQICQSGTCTTLEGQCSNAGEECDASRPAGDGFQCLDLDAFGPRPGECVAPCSEDGSCPSGSLCFFVTSTADPECSSDTDCEVGRECSDGSCLQTICRQSECDGFVDGAATCSSLYANFPEFANGGQCYEVGNEARYCYPGGNRRSGESCGSVIDAIISNDYSNTCASGFACVDSVCQRACLDDAACTDSEECILEEQDFVDIGTGICGDACTPFEVGSCGAGRTCLPVSGEEGVCADAGDAVAFDSCQPGAGDCEDGTVCISYQGDPAAVARCQPMCNLTVAPANEDGSVGEFAQSQRDATCPQSAPAQSSFAVINVAETGTPIDVYVGDVMAPTIAALGLDATSDGDAAIAGAQYLTLDPGTYTVRVLPAGAPSTDPPLAEQTLSMAADGATEMFVLPVFGAADEVTLLAGAVPRDVLAPPPGRTKLRVLDALVDAPMVDAILVPVGDDLSQPANQVELLTGATPASISTFVEVAAQDWDLLVFAVGDPRTARATALVATTVAAGDGAISTLAVRGTVDPDDLPLAGSAMWSFVAPPPVGQGGPRFTCVDVGAPAFGFCQQACGNDSSGFGAVCEGEMGCHPTFLPANNQWASLCSPLGSKAVGDLCDPFAEFTECAEGSYCLEYGNTVAGFDSIQRGRCTSLCVEGSPADPVLACATDQSCETISFDPDYLIGRCGFPCAPDTSYEDAGCPAGLRSCKPKAALIDDPANPDALPTTRATQSYCSAAGDIASGDTCAANDCVAGTECMFPRSEQGEFTSTLLSQYFGGPGLTPSCTPQCDPFEGDSSSTTCASDETCLFNFPYSGEVGHCALIEEQLTPLQPCNNPGRSCGRDSICVVNGGAPTCFQFCQYTGPDPSGEPKPETCAAGFFCAPLVNDIGVCLSPA